MNRRALLTSTLLLAPSIALAGEAKTAGPVDTYVPLDPLSLTASRANGTRGVMTVEVGIDVPDAKLRAQVALLLPRLRSALLEAVQIYMAGVAPGGLPNADLLEQRMQAAANTALGSSGGHVLLGSIMQN